MVPDENESHKMLRYNVKRQDMNRVGTRTANSNLRLEKEEQQWR